MKETYLILHVYDVDGGFGNSVAVDMPIGVVDSEDDAKEYIERWNNDHVYDIPYSDLHCGGLTYEKLTHIHNLHLPPYEYNELVSWAFDTKDSDYNNASDYVKANQEEDDDWN